jgi:hypothetical protein
VWKKAIDARAASSTRRPTETILQAIKEIDAAATGRVDVREYAVRQPRYPRFALTAVMFWTLAISLQMTLRCSEPFRDLHVLCGESFGLDLRSELCAFV